MAPSKKKKIAKSAYDPVESNQAKEIESTTSLLPCPPTWTFACADQEGPWAFSKDRLHVSFWEKVFPKLIDWEKMTWQDIFLAAKKQNHHIPTEQLNKRAMDRLKELQLFPEDLLSLRLGGTLRLYGFLSGPVYVILWYDDNHGDNDTCVCRSYKKHT